MIIKNINEKTWKIIIEYASSICDTVLLSKCYDQWLEENSEIQDLLYNQLNANDIKYVTNKIYLEDFLEKDELLEISDKMLSNFVLNISLYVSSKPIEEFIEELMKNPMFKKTLLKSKKVNKNYEDDHFLVNLLKKNLNWFFYKKQCNFFLEEFKEEKNFEKDYLFEEEYMKDTELYKKRYKTFYGFQIDDRIIKIFLNKNPYEWRWPINLDNICFKKNGKVWLYLIVNRQLCEIFCDSTEELEHLKSLGIVFDEAPIDNKPITLDDLAKL